MADTLPIFCHHVHGSIWPDEVVFRRECVSELPNHGVSITHAGLHEHWVSGCISDRMTLELIHGREGWNQFMHD